MSLFESRHYRLASAVAASALDDDGRARFPGDTRFPPGSEFVIVSGKSPWPTARDPLHYVIEMRSPGTSWREGARYAVLAEQLETAMQPVHAA